MLSTDMASLGTDFQIPVFFFEGALDNRASPVLAKQYFENISAPHKEFAPFEATVGRRPPI